MTAAWLRIAAKPHVAAIDFANWISASLATADLGLPRLTGPCLVLGSAPTAVLPDGYASGWNYISVNAAQAIGERLGAGTPLMTVFAGRMLGGDNATNREGQEVLRGLGTKHVVFLERRNGVELARQRLATMQYTFHTITPASPSQRAKLVKEVLGQHLMLRGGPNKISTGMWSVALALHQGAAPVVMSGFSLTKAGHGYNSSNRRRNHVDHDRTAMAIIASRRMPVYAADAALAEESGLRLWRSNPSGR